MRTLFFCCVALCWAATAAAQDLGTFLDAAAHRDAKYLSAWHNSLAAADNPHVAWADYLPRVSIQADASQTSQNIQRVNNPLYSSGRSSYSAEDYSLVVQQPIFDWGAIERIGQADAQAAQALAQLEGARQDLILRVSEAYFSLLVAGNTLSLTLAEKQVVAKHAEQAKAQWQRGFAGRPDVADAAARYSLIEAKEIDARNQIEDGIQALAELTGLRPQSILSIDANASLQVLQPDSIDHWVQASVEHSPAISEKRHAVQVARSELDARSAGHYPTLNLTAKYGRQDTGGASYGGGGALIDTGQVLLSLNIPIYQGGKISAQERQAEQMLEAAVADEEQARRTVERKARAAFLSVKNSIKRAEALHESVEAQQVALRAKQQGYKKGVYSVIDVLAAQKILTEAKTEYEKARCEYFLNRLRLQQAAGQITEDDLLGIHAALNTPVSLLE